MPISELTQNAEPRVTKPKVAPLERSGSGPGSSPGSRSSRFSKPKQAEDRLSSNENNYNHESTDRGQSTPRKEESDLATGPAAIKAILADFELLIAHGAVYIDAQRDLFLQQLSGRARETASNLVSSIVLAVSLGCGLILTLMGLVEGFRELFDFAPWLAPLSVGIAVSGAGIIYVSWSRRKKEAMELKAVQAKYVAHAYRVSSRKAAAVRKNRSDLKP